MGTLLGFFGILKIFFLKIFENSTLHGTLGKNFSIKLSQNTIKTRLDSFGDDFARFWKFEIFNDFFENFRRLDPPWKTGQKFFEKFAPKHIQNMFGDFWERFWAFSNFEKKNLKIFENSTFHGALGIKFFRKNHPKTRLDTFGNTFGHF